MPTREGYTQIEFPKDLAAILKIESRRLGFSNIAEYVDILNRLRLKTAWTKLDLEILVEFGKLPTVELLTEDELNRRGYRKVSEFTPVKADVAKPFTETMTIEIPTKAKKKQRKPKKKCKERGSEYDSEKKMPTSSEFFKGDK